MPTYTLRPSSFVTGGGSNAWGGVTSNAQMASYLGDNSDTTFATRGTTVIGTTRSYFGLTAPSIPSTEFICRASHFIRWKGGGADQSPATENLGVLTYRASDTAPTTANTFSPDGRTTITTTDVGYNIVSWSNTDAATLRSHLYDYRSAYGMLTLTVYDIGSTLYTLTKATATVSNQTVTTAAKPTIPVTMTVTQGWEASEPEVSNLKRVVTEIRIESGGTTVGTGTLVGYGYTDQYNATTGTVNVVSQQAIANGTYKVYARSSRFREGQTVDAAIAATDQGTWSTGATLTMNNPLPTAPTTTATVVQSFDYVQISATPVATASFTAPIVDIERTDDGGTTWTAIRGGTGIAGTFGSATIVRDYEMPRGVAVQYRARVTATYTGGFTMTSTWTTPAAVTVTINADWNLKVVTVANGVLNMYDAQVIDKPSEELTENLGVFRPLDRRTPIVVAGTLGGWDGDLQIITSTAAEWDKLKALLEAQTVIYLESAFGWSKYIRITSGARMTTSGTIGMPVRRVTVNYVEVQAP